MLANELRLGNYVMYYNDFCPIDLEQFNYMEVMDNYHPIPLTEQWLLDFKAVKVKDCQFEISRFRLTYFTAYDYWFVTDIDDNTYMTKIEFVHEFQNFMFVMDGEELTIK